LDVGAEFAQDPVRLRGRVPQLLALETSDRRNNALDQGAIAILPELPSTARVEPIDAQNAIRYRRLAVLPVDPAPSSLYGWPAKIRGCERCRLRS